MAIRRLRPTSLEETGYIQVSKHKMAVSLFTIFSLMYNAKDIVRIAMSFDNG